MMIGFLLKEEVIAMGTSKSGRYLNTKGNRRHASDFAVVHSNEGKFKWRNKRDCKNGEKSIRLEGGGHGEDGRKLLDKYGIEYHIVKTFNNGVRIGYIPDHDKRNKQSGTGMSWFPPSWDAKKIKRAGEHVAQLKRNANPKDGITMFGVYKGVRVGVIMTNGQIGTIFPDSDQNKSCSRRKK